MNTQFTRRSFLAAGAAATAAGLAPRAFATISSIVIGLP